RTARNLRKREAALWTFVWEADVEPTNNSAERPLRRAVLWRRRSFGTQSATGSQFVEQWGFAARLGEDGGILPRVERQTLRRVMGALGEHRVRMGSPARGLPDRVSPLASRQETAGHPQA